MMNRPLNPDAHPTPPSNYPACRKSYKIVQNRTFSPRLPVFAHRAISFAKPRALVLGFLLATSTLAAPPSTQPSPPPGYHLVFSDDFSHPGPPNPKLWSYELGLLRNHEAQLYTPHNATVRDGSLVIEARKEDTPLPHKPGKTAHYTSASLYSTQSWLYAHIDVRAKIPMARGTWPAIWFLGDSIRHGTPWPLCGEIDLMEHVGHDPSHIHQSIHTQAYNWPHHTQKTAITEVKDLDTSFHTYTLDWTPEKIEMSIDGTRYFSFPNEHKSQAEWPFNKPQHLKLNLAIGGDWGGQKGIDDTAFPQQFLIDSVQVYQRDNP